MLELQNSPEVMEIIKNNPEAMTRFNDYMVKADAEIKAACKEFSTKLDGIIANAFKEFFEKENIPAPKVTGNFGAVTKEMLAKVDAQVVEQFKLMSAKAKAVK